MVASATCHPDRPLKGRGMCAYCYGRDRAARGKDRGGLKACGCRRWQRCPTHAAPPRVCPGCGIEFVPTPRSHNQSYCTTPCYTASHLTTRESSAKARRCVICGMRVAFFAAGEWAVTHLICGNHVDMGHCVEHCPDHEEEQWTRM